LLNECASHLGVQSEIQSANHSQSDSESDSRIELWNDLPNADAGVTQLSVRRSAPQTESGSLSKTARNQ